MQRTTKRLKRELWWFHPDGQLSSTSTPPLQRKRWRKIEWKWLMDWDKDREIAYWLPSWANQTQHREYIPQVHAGSNKAIHSVEKGGRINMRDTNIHVQCFWNGFRYLGGSEWKRMWLRRWTRMNGRNRCDIVTKFFTLNLFQLRSWKVTVYLCLFLWSILSLLNHMQYSILLRVNTWIMNLEAVLH